MTATEMRTFFDLLQDKSGSPWFNDSEKDLFLLDVQLDMIGEEIKRLEEDKNSTERIKTLIKSDTQSTDANGVLLDSVFEDAAAGAAPPLLLKAQHYAKGLR